MNDSSQGRERNLESSFESSRGLKRREYAVERTGGSKQISDPGRRERGASGELAALGRGRSLGGVDSHAKCHNFVESRAPAT